MKTHSKILILKKLTLLIVFLASFLMAKAQNDEGMDGSNKGFYVGIDYILTTIDKWNLGRNDLNLELFDESSPISGSRILPVVGYHLGKNFRAELSYWKKDFYHGTKRRNGSYFQDETYKAHIFSGRVKYDLSIWRKKLFFSPSIGLSYAYRSDKSQSNGEIDEFTYSTAYHQGYFITLDYGIGAKMVFSNGIYFHSHVYVHNGIDEVATARYDDMILGNNEFSRIISKGTTLAITLGLGYSF